MLGCGGSGGASRGLSGTIRIDGSSELYPLAQQAAQEFQHQHPGVRVTVGQSGADSGVDELCTGEIDIADLAGPMTPAEAASCKPRHPGAIAVADDGVALIANPDLRVGCLSTTQLTALWTDSSDVQSLRELGRDAGSGRRLPSASLDLFAPPADSGPSDLFTDRVNGEAGSGRGDYTSADADDIVGEIAKDDTGLGYVEYGAYKPGAGGLTELGVDQGGGCIRPQAATIANGSYPLSQRLEMYVEPEAEASKPALPAFLRLVSENRRRLATGSDLVPLARSR